MNTHLHNLYHKHISLSTHVRTELSVEKYASINVFLIIHLQYIAAFNPVGKSSVSSYLVSAALH